jgi:UDP-2,3-diacylglucosamine pyrophosphatase LpxH
LPEPGLPFQSADYHLLIVSDLHLSEGRDEQSHRLSRNEDFFFDEEFARFLQYHAKLDSRCKWHLIINGDFLDFLQVVSVRFDDEFVRYLGVTTAKEARHLLQISRQNTKYGFDAGPGETVFKLWKILDGHWLFTFALVEFLEQGNRLSIGRGNHDPEFQYELVRDHFRKMLFWFYSEKMRQGTAAPDELENFRQTCDGIQFLDWFYYEPGVIWVEHGSQYDQLNSFPHWLVPYLPHSDHIEMPWGSFFVRYLFNSIEIEQPFADNIKPPTDFLIWFISRKPVLAIRFVFGNGREMLKKMAAAWRTLPKHDPRPAEHAARLKQLAAEWQLDSGILQDLDSRQEMSVLREPHGIWKLWKWLTRGWRFSLILLAYLLITVVIGGLLILGQILSPTIPGSVAHALSHLIHLRPWIATVVKILLVSRWFTFVYLLGALALFIRQMFPSKPATDNLVINADYIQQKLQVPYVTMGHTHDTNLVTFRSGAEYYNTGTWTKVFSPEERLIREESELVFLQCLRDEKGLTCRLMKWDDGPGEPRLVKLFNLAALPRRR